MFKDRTNQELIDKGCDVMERFMAMDIDASSAVALAYILVGVFRIVQKAGILSEGEAAGLIRAEELVELAWLMRGLPLG